MVAGNVETSTCITNALYGALGVMAAQPGHDEQLHLRQRAAPVLRNHLAAARGARRPGFDGTSVVQTHMTNSRLTDPEVLEFRFPVRLESYEIRHGSGGAGRWHGGDGGVRRVRFLEADDGQHPVQRPHASAPSAWPAAQPGQVGLNRVVRADGSVEELAHIGQAEMQPGDVFEIHTPGGGGFGSA